MRLRTRSLAGFLAAALAIGSVISVAAPSAPVARAATNLELCGTVSVYVAPSALLAGAITVGGIPFAIVAGADVSGDVDVGAKLCLRLTLNASGSITDLVVVRADATSTLRICGEVTAYVEATALATGKLTIGGTTFTIAVDTDLPASVDVGDDLCATLELNGFGQIKDADVTANATSTLRICGEVTAFSEATASQTGDLTIGGRHLVVALDADLPAAVGVGADLCATLELNGFGQIQDGNVVANVTSEVEICGTVHAFTAATATKTGDLSIANEDFVVAMGADLPAQVAAGANLCLALELNAFGQIQDGTASANVESSLTVCGQVTAFSAASSSTNGHVTIGGTTKAIAAGTDVDSRVTVGAFLKLRLTMNALGRVTDVAVLRVGVSVADACSGVTPTDPPTPTPSTGTGPTPTPTTGTGPTPTPSTGTGPTPTPTTGTGPTPMPTPSGGNGPTPAPSQPPQGSPGSQSPPPDVCGPVDGSGTGSDSNAAPDLPDTASSVERAGMVIASAAVPFAILVFTLALAGVIAWWRRRAALAFAAAEDVVE